jgi:hypothetical protein
MNEQTEPWHWWFQKLSGHPVQMNPSNPHAGFYRMPSKAFYGARKTFLPVAYWPGEDGQLHCRIGDEDVAPERGQGIWERVGNYPVTEAAYREVAEKGGLWPDEHELVPMAGDNLPPEDTSYEGLRDEIENLGRAAAIRLEGPAITNQDEADQVANLADKLSELYKKADETHKQEKMPFDEGAIEVQKKWAPILLRAETYKNLKYKLLTPWLKLLEKRAQEAKTAAAATGQAVAQEGRARAGTRGKAMTLRSQKRAEITDYAVTLAFFAESPDVKATVQDLANRAVRAGISVPGVNVLEESQAV